MSSLLAQQLKAGIQYQNAGRLTDAMTLYQQILSQDPNQPDALYLSGILSFNTGNPAMAKAMVQRAVSHAPGNPAFYKALGSIHQSLGERAEAEACYRHSLKLDPFQESVAEQLTQLMVQSGRRLETVRTLRRLLRAFPENLPMLLTLALSYRDQGLEKPDTSKHQQRWQQKAMTVLDNVLTVDPNNRIGLKEQMTLAMALHQWDKVIRCGERLIQLEPGYSVAYRLCGFCYTFLGKFDAAIERLKTAITLEPENPQLVECLKRAATFYKESLEPDPINLEAYCNQSPALGNETMDIVMVASNPIHAFGGGQNPSQVAWAFHRMGHRLLYLDFHNELVNDTPFPVLSDSFMLQNQEPTPFQRNRITQSLTRFTRHDSANRLVIFTTFSPYILSLMDDFKSLGYRTAYWCLDDWEHMGWPEVTSGTEEALAKQVDLLFATAQPLAERVSRMTGGRPVEVIRNGFGLSHFNQDPTQPPPPRPTDLLVGEEKTLIFWGQIQSEWLNQALLTDLVSRNPHWAFNLIGAVIYPDELIQAANIRYLGKRNVSELAAYGHYADIGFIHFLENELTRAVNPVKAYEYLACGLPVISTPMPELDDFPGTWQVRTVEEFEQAVRDTEVHPPDPEAIQAFLKTASWEHRAQTVLAHLARLS
jgi:tetratricopeptide (TPR) repeat protein